jgi:hypothetical protein
LFSDLALLRATCISDSHLILFAMVLSPFLLICAYESPKSLINSLGLKLLDGHPVIHALYAVYIFDVFGGQVPFRCAF